MSEKIKKDFINEIGKIIENKNLVDNIWEMKIFCPKISGMAIAGQFVNIKVASEGLDPILRRPISICEISSSEESITIVYAVVGRGTQLMTLMKKDSDIEVLGPVGNGFGIEEPAKKIAIVGGGIGTVPLLQLVKALRNSEANNAAITDVYLGFRGNPYKTADFTKYSSSVTVATENGCEGFTGFVTEPFSEKVKEYDLVYACGPEIMLSKVASICHEAGIKLYVSMEERMACGIGACLVCVCKTVSDNELGWHHSKVCTEGPIFDSKEVFQWK